MKACIFQCIYLVAGFKSVLLWYWVESVTLEIGIIVKEE
jgi:hypothetical protein